MKVLIRHDLFFGRIIFFKYTATTGDLQSPDWNRRPPRSAGLPLTVAKWAFLWLIENPLAVGGKLTEPAIDVALYVLSHELAAAREYRRRQISLPTERGGAETHRRPRRRAGGRVLS